MDEINVLDLIIRLRQERGMSAVELGGAIGYSRAQMWRIEKKKCVPPFSFVVKCLGVMGYDLKVVRRDLPVVSPAI